MKIKFGAIIIAIFIGLMLITAVSAQRVCDPFTTTPDVGMLAIGQVVEFLHYEGAPAPVTRTGKISAYYIQSCFPNGGSIIGLDSQAYVVDYGSADGSRIILNRGALTIH